MSLMKRNAILAALAGATLLVSTAAQAEMVLHRGNGTEIETLDPAKSTGVPESNIQYDLLEGLTTYSVDGQIVPGMAESWDVSDDGKTYTFHLRDSKWSNGDPVTAGDFVYSMRRLVDPATASDYAYITDDVAGSSDIRQGKEKDITKLGVTAVDDKTLKITLAHATPYFLGLLRHSSVLPVNEKSIKAHPDDWTKPGNLVSNGAYKLTEWTPQDAAAALNHPQRVRVVRDASGEIDHLEKDNYIYAFLLDGVKLFNTEQYFKSHGHTPFPERGASEIPPENLLCEIHFVAKWFYSEAGGQIMLYELAFDPIRWLPSRSYIEVVIGESGVNELEAIILKEIAKARSRSDITGEKVVYDRQRRTRFSAAERQQVAQELSAFLKSPAAPKIPNAHKERTAVIQKLPAMAEKINSLDVKAWNEFRATAKLLP